MSTSFSEMLTSFKKYLRLSRKMTSSPLWCKILNRSDKSKTSPSGWSTSGWRHNSPQMHQTRVTSLCWSREEDTVGILTSFSHLLLCGRTPKAIISSATTPTPDTRILTSSLPAQVQPQTRHHICSSSINQMIQHSVNRSFLWDR